ncbi:MAG: type II toxin-antitoxin system ParD family antitoxin [bacterium]|nr:type II toxin-antitoxin system ParD family antitoxin [bacterium]
MAMVKKSITVTDQQEKWIQSQMATGAYGTDSELIREALREKQNRTDEIEYIRARLIASEQSGFTKLSPNEILEKSKEELRKNGDL